jgi:hypothetical protein
MAAQTSRARGMSFPPDDSFGWLDDLYAVPSTGESDDGCLLFFDPKNARRIFYVHINRLLVHIGTFDPVHIGLLLSAKLTTAWTVQFHLPLPCRCRGRATGRPCGDSCWQRLEIPGRSKGTQRAAHAVSLALSPMSALKRIVLKKSFWGDDQNFSGPLMPFARGDMRDHIVSHKNDHGASYWRYAVLQWWSRLKIGFCEIFGVVQFSTFATLSSAFRTQVRHRAESERCQQAT